MNTENIPKIITIDGSSYLYQFEYKLYFKNGLRKITEIIKVTKSQCQSG